MPTDNTDDRGKSNILRQAAADAITKSGNANLYTLALGKYTAFLRDNESKYAIANRRLHSATVRRIEAYSEGKNPQGFAINWTAKPQSLWQKVRETIAELPGSVFVPASDGKEAYWIIGGEADHQLAYASIAAMPGVTITLNTSIGQQMRTNSKAEPKTAKVAKPKGRPRTTPAQPRFVSDDYEMQQLQLANAQAEEAKQAAHLQAIQHRIQNNQYTPIAPLPAPIVQKEQPEIMPTDTTPATEPISFTATPLDYNHYRAAMLFPDSIVPICDAITDLLPSLPCPEYAVISNQLWDNYNGFAKTADKDALDGIAMGAYTGLCDIIKILQSDMPTKPDDIDIPKRGIGDVARYQKESIAYMEACQSVGAKQEALKVIEDNAFNWLRAANTDAHAKLLQLRAAEAEAEVAALDMEAKLNAIAEASKQTGSPTSDNAMQASAINRSAIEAMELALDRPKPRTSFHIDTQTATCLSAIAYQLIKTGKAPNVLLTGLPGTGKTELAREFAARLGFAFYRANCALIADSVQMFGRSGVRATEQGPETYTRESLFTYACQRPNTVILLDEVNRFSDPQIASSLFPMLDDSRCAWIEELQNTVSLAENVIIFATRNRDGDAGTTGTSDALTSRFAVHVEAHMPDCDTLQDILLSSFGDSKTIEALAKWHINTIDPGKVKPKGLAKETAKKLSEVITGLNEQFKKGELSISLGVREAKNAAALFAIGGAATLKFTLANRYNDDSMVGNSERTTVSTIFQTTFSGYAGE